MNIEVPGRKVNDHSNHSSDSDFEPRLIIDEPVAQRNVVEEKADRDDDISTFKRIVQLFVSVTTLLSSFNLLAYTAKGNGITGRLIRRRRGGESKPTSYGTTTGIIEAQASAR